MRLALFQPDIAPNVGATIRIAACFGLPLDVIGPTAFPASTKSLRRAALDYGAWAEVTYHASWDTFRTAHPARLILATTTASAAPWEIAFREGDVILVGSETAGVPDAVHRDADTRTRIPMPGGGRSLNVAVSAGILLSEATRQGALGTVSPHP
ncbi:MAG: TrmH family RNA methyltransferase [Pseudomonadota bacterium]